MNTFAIRVVFGMESGYRAHIAAYPPTLIKATSKY